MMIFGECYKRSLLEEGNDAIVFTIQFDRHSCAYFCKSEPQTVTDVNDVTVQQK